MRPDNGAFGRDPGTSDPPRLGAQDGSLLALPTRPKGTTRDVVGRRGRGVPGSSSVARPTPPARSRPSSFVPRRGGGGPRRPKPFNHARAPGVPEFRGGVWARSAQHPATRASSGTHARRRLPSVRGAPGGAQSSNDGRSLPPSLPTPLAPRVAGGRGRRGRTRVVRRQGAAAVGRRVAAIDDRGSPPRRGWRGRGEGRRRRLTGEGGRGLGRPGPVMDQPLRGPRRRRGSRPR